MKEKNKLRPCDCVDIATANRLETQGIKHNDQGIYIEPNSVFLTMGHTTIRIPMNRFRMFAEWYLEPQELDKIAPASDPSTQEEIEAKKDQLWDEFLYDVGSRMNFLTGQTGPDHPEKMRTFLEGKWDIEIKRKNLKS